MSIKVRELPVKLAKNPAQKPYDKPFNAIENVLKDTDTTETVIVKDDAMAKAGITNGSYLLIDKSLPVKNGDIVYCFYEDEWLVRFYEKHNGSTTLYAAQPGMPAIQATAPLIIKGVVVWAIKCLNNGLGL